MRIINEKGTIDTEKEFVVILFNDDNEMNAFLTKVAQTKVRTSGIRLVINVPDGMELNPIQKKLLDVLYIMDGMLGNDKKVHEKKSDEAIEILNGLIKLGESEDKE